MCSKPVSTTNLDTEVELFCQQCEEDLTKLDCGFDDNINPKRGMERKDRDDEGKVMMNQREIPGLMSQMTLRQNATSDQHAWSA